MTPSYTTMLQCCITILLEVTNHLTSSEHIQHYSNTYTFIIIHSWSTIVSLFKNHEQTRFQLVYITHSDGFIIQFSSQRATFILFGSKQSYNSTNPRMTT